MSAFLGSGALWYVSRATGVVAMVLLSMVVVLGVVVSRRVRVPGLPRFAVAELHRRVSLIAAVFVALHVLTAVTDTYVSIPLVAVIVPFTSAYEPLQVGLGAIAADLGIAIVVTSLLRARIGIRAWRRVHWLGYAAFPVALLHGFTSAKDLRSGAVLVVTGVCALAVAAAVCYRLAAPGRPQASARRSVHDHGSLSAAAADRIP
jgi:methionine sulfoxide reductase heme-binding subunit